jgi:hypothetical protein
MKYNYTRKRKIALLLLAVILSETLIPSVALALTSGPAQPEVTGFQPADTSEMVDLKSGDLNYNIPLLDIDGYPLNLGYSSGVGIDDEASWVGLGWSLNVGSINRQVRGLPDDMLGDDVTTSHFTKPKITVGGRINAKTELFGIGELGKNNVFGIGSVSGSFTFGIFSDNYTGIGAEIGVNPGITLTKYKDKHLTAGLGLGVFSNTANGVSVSPYLNINIRNKSDEHRNVHAGLNASLGYNTRSGMKGLTLGTSFGYNYARETKTNSGKYTTGGDNINLVGTSISYNTEPIIPSIDVPYETDYVSFSGDLGGAKWAFYEGFGVTGYKSVTSVPTRTITKPGYGFLYAEAGKNVAKAVMDFSREKDNPVVPELANLAVPVPTPDLFSYTSQEGSGQFRLFRGGTGIFFDSESANIENSNSIGVEVGVGSYAHFGGSVYSQHPSSVTHKWVKGNGYSRYGDFQDASAANPDYQHVGFKVLGEKTYNDDGVWRDFLTANPVAVKVASTIAENKFSNSPEYLPRLQKAARQPQQTSIAFLTAKEAVTAGLDRTINRYEFNNITGFTLPLNNKPLPVELINRTEPDGHGYRKAHHISEMSVIDGQGKRMVYGIPVYNTNQSEYTFAIGSAPSPLNPAPGYQMFGNSKDQIQFNYGQGEGTLGVGKGIDDYYHKDSRSPYATSYLLTGILSPDYVDGTGDGITDDDIGSAIKFNYSMIPRFRWRTPYTNATLNKGLQADPDDDKANIVFGEKELWYVNSIETKTKVVYFITEDRLDALGVLNFSGGPNTALRQKRLREIRLYSKTDMSKPIKVVKFDYDYSLCPNTPNNLNTINGNTVATGKLTLTGVHFEYAGTTKGQYFPYKFSYNTDYTNINTQVTPNVGYGTMHTDRWGTYRDDSDLPLNLKNDEYPYAVQDLYKASTDVSAKIKSSAAMAASLWHLKKIELPTGGVIDIDYESDEYAYVQDKKAMAMYPVEGLINDDATYSSTSSLATCKGIKIKLPVGVADMADATTWFRNNYLNGSAYIYSKFSVKVSTSYSSSKGQDYDFIPCYSEVQKVNIKSGYANVILKDRTVSSVTRNPIVFAAWQRMKNEYPRYCYPGFDRRIGSASLGAKAENVVKAIIAAISNLTELRRNFYEKASAANSPYANIIQPNKNFVRLVKSDGRKYGGGVRVSKIVINDGWTGSAAKSYGQAYNYDTPGDDGALISSGVASWEPSVGGDENPLKQPVFYMERTKGALDNLFDIEEPFGESFFPSPSVVYSKVTVTDLDGNLKPYPKGPTGYTVSEFYTAKDFPVQVDFTDIQRYQPRGKWKYTVLETSNSEPLTLSQGYAIELNDMHGKPHATRVYNQLGAEISSQVNYYNTEIGRRVPLRLKNKVSIVRPTGVVETDKVIGRDIDFFTDFREQETVNLGDNLNLGLDVISIAGWPIPIPHWPQGDNTEYKLFRSACSIKVSQYYGLVDSVVVNNNGSTIRTSNVAYDGNTGQPVVTKTQNEFKKDIYTVNIPAYWGYPGMGPAAATNNMILSHVKTNAKGELDNAFTPYLTPGDELVDKNTGAQYWIVDELIQTSTGTPAYTPGSGGYIIDNGIGGFQHIEHLINRYGRIQKNADIELVKVTRAGNRNVLNAGLSTLVFLTNPIVQSEGQWKLWLDNKDPAVPFKVLNATANTYDENWTTGAPDIHVIKNHTNVNLGIIGGGAIQTTNSGTYLMNNTYSPGHTFVTSDHGGGTKITSPYFDISLTRASIMDNTNALISTSNSNVMGAYGTFYAPENKVYWIGFDSSIKMSFYIDCNTIPMSFESHNDLNKFGWNIIPITLPQGQHTIQIELTYAGYIPSGGSSVGGGVEIYDNTIAQLQNAGSTGAGINTIWTSKSLTYTPSVQSYVKIPGQAKPIHNLIYNDPEQSPYTPCDPAPLYRNPYLFGFAGNWRPYQTMVYEKKRVYTNIINPATTLLNISTAGYLDDFYSYWLPTAGQNKWSENRPANKYSWVMANKVMLYDRFGQESENKDALDRYSAAKFDFNGELPGAVANNSKSREIYENSFEDAQISGIPSVYLEQPPGRDFTYYAGAKPINKLAQQNVSHTGLTSALLPNDAVTLVTLLDDSEHKSGPYLDIDADRQYIKATRRGLYPDGFVPQPNKEYLFSAWIKDGDVNSLTSKLKFFVNGIDQPLTCKALVEDWKLVECKFTTPASGPGTVLNLSMRPDAGATVYVDDIRMHPYVAHMKTYVYDPTTFRLMAELDENGFATLYEYDSEGLLVRVKKETERGVVTIKETRSSKKKGQI